MSPSEDNFKLARDAILKSDEARFNQLTGAKASAQTHALSALMAKIYYDKIWKVYRNEFRINRAEATKLERFIERCFVKTAG